MSPPSSFRSPPASPGSRLAASTPEQLARATAEAIAAARAGIDTVTAGTLRGEELLEAYDEATAALENARHVAELVSQAHPDPAMRAAADAAERDLDQASTGIALDRRVYDALAAVDLAAADPPTRHWVTRTLRDFRRAGVDRDEATRARIRELREELVAIGQTFSQHLNADTRSVRVPASALDGLPADWVAAHPPGEDGLVTVTTDSPDVVPFLSYSRDAGAREQLLRQWRRRGHPDNVEVLHRLLARRHELATLLGYPSWAEYATEDKMIGSEQAVAEFIAGISEASGPRMRRDYAMLLAQKQAEDPAATAVDPWDKWYLVERVKADQYGYDGQAIRAYLGYDRVKEGLLAVSATLFGISFTPRPDLPVWHPEVEAYDVHDGDTLLGRIFLDMHPRPDKFSHAAMYELVTGEAGRRLPECALLCNLPRPGAGPALLEHADVETFFHEFGHLLHHLFAGHQRWSGTSGVKTERDFIEAPSQLLEEWTRDPDTLATFAVHHETGEPLPAHLVETLRAATAFGEGLNVRQQMFYATLSLELYRRDPAELDPLAVEREAQQRHTPFPHLDGTWLHLSFGHLVGYSARYYTYMWSLVIAKDLFSAFDGARAPDRRPGGDPGEPDRAPGDRPRLLDPAVAARYRETVLAPGGSAPAAELVRGFLGRDYTFDAYRAWLDTPPDPDLGPAAGRPRDPVE